MTNRAPSTPWLDPAVPTPGRASSRRTVPAGLLPPAPYLLARWTIWLAMAGFGVGVVLLVWMLADPIEFDPDADGIAQAIFSGIVTHPPILVLLAYGAVYYAVSSLWLHRSRKFATAVNPYHSQRLGAAWVWLGWLVPIVNFWFPYLVVRDIKAATDGGDQGKSTVVWWWWLSIAAGVLSQRDGAFFAVLSAIAALVGLRYWLSIVTAIANAQQGHVRAAERAARSAA
jgi:hypothetical protein